MSWEGEPNFRWVKMHKGHRYRVHCADLPITRENWTWEGSYQAANEWWTKKLATLQTVAIDPSAAEVLRRIEWLKNHKEEEEAKSLEALAKEGKDSDEETAKDVLALLRSQGFTIEVPEGADMQIVKEVFGGMQIWQERRAREEPKPSNSLSTACDDFLRLSQANQKANTFRELKAFIDKLPDDLPAEIDAIDERIVSATFERFAESTMSAGRKKKHWGFFKRFVKFLCESNRLKAIPRNLDSRIFQFRVSPSAIKTHTTEEVKAVLKALPKRLKLFALLGLNCAMTNADISALKHDAVKDGYLIRKRVKTEQHTNVPTVKYKLWKETLKLLMKFKSNHETLWFTSNKNTELVCKRIVGGKVVQKDLIAKVWKKAKAKIMLKEFRSIGSTALESSKEYAHFSTILLGHSPRSVKDRHYSAYSQERFDEALDWLARQFGL